MISKDLYGCAAARNKGTCDNWRNIRRDVLEATVFDGLRSHLMDPELFKEFVTEFTRELNRLRSADSANHARMRAELATIGRKIRKIIDAITDGVPALSLKDEVMALEARQEELNTKLANAKDPEPLIHPNLAEIYRRKVADLNEALNQDDVRAEAGEIIRSLIDEIVLTPDGEALRIDLKGELAAILSLAADSKKPAPYDRDRLLGMRC